MFRMALYSQPVYKAKLAELQPDMPHPKHCLGLNCQFKPTCYTDYMPHYTPSLTLNNTFLKPINWTLQDAEYGAWSLTYGYLDGKPAYAAGHGRESGELHIRVRPKNTNFVWLCGEGVGVSGLPCVYFRSLVSLNANRLTWTCLSFRSVIVLCSACV